MMNIILIGMPGVGKSTLGVLLAKTLGKDFIDTDIIIQQKEGMKLYEIIEERGISSFLHVEENHILGLKIDNCVVATGGSVVYGEKAMEHLKTVGTIVYLKLEYMEIRERLKDITTRGVAMKKGTSLMQLYDERTPMYEKYADVTIDCNKKGIERIVEEIAKKYKKINCRISSKPG